MTLMTGANEHVLTGRFCKALMKTDNGLDLEEISHKAWGGKKPNTYIDSSKPIDGVYAPRSLEVSGFKMLSFGESMGVYSIST